MDDVTPDAERWLPVPGWEDLYLISDQGHVWSIRRRLILKPSYANRGGYPLVILFRKGYREGKYPHQMVMEAFVGPCPPGLEVRHLDGDGKNPALRDTDGIQRLAYGTHGENQWDQVRHGTHYQGSRTQCDNGHDLTEDNIWIEYYPDGTFKARRCKACNRDRSTKQRAKRKTDDRRCKEEGCGKPYFAMDWCSMHYGRWYRAQKAKGDAPDAA
jgi:hypothetical protein